MTETESSTTKQTWPYVAVALALLAVAVSVVAWFFAYRADVVQLPTPTNTPEIDVYRAQVEELQRANDRILNTAWATLGVVVTLATVLIAFNFARGDRLLERERALVEEQTLAKTSAADNRLDTKIDQEATSRFSSDIEMNGRIVELQEQLASALVDIQVERRNGARSRHDLIETRNWLFRLDNRFTTSQGDFLPFVMTRIYGEVSTAIGMFYAALDTGHDGLISNAIARLAKASKGSIPAFDPFPVDDLIAKLLNLSPSFNPSRDDAIMALRILADSRRDLITGTSDDASSDANG